MYSDGALVRVIRVGPGPTRLTVKLLLADGCRINNNDIDLYNTDKSFNKLIIIIIIINTVFVYAISLAIKPFRGALHYTNIQITIK